MKIKEHMKNKMKKCDFMVKLKNEKELKEENRNRGITLIALVVTIIVLLILARSINPNVNRGKWFAKNGTRCKR